MRDQLRRLLRADCCEIRCGEKCPWVLKILSPAIADAPIEPVILTFGHPILTRRPLWKALVDGGRENDGHPSSARGAYRAGVRAVLPQQSQLWLRVRRHQRYQGESRSATTLLDQECVSQRFLGHTDVQGKFYFRLFYCCFFWCVIAQVPWIEIRFSLARGSGPAFIPWQGVQGVLNLRVRVRFIGEAIPQSKITLGLGYKHTLIYAPMLY